MYTKPVATEAQTTRPMSRREELKYMNQRSNLVLGYYDFTNGAERQASSTYSAVDLYVSRAGNH